MAIAVYGMPTYGSVLYGENAKPVVASVRAIGRKLLEVEFLANVRVRSVDLATAAPSDPYTQVDWVALGGDPADAANAANFTIIKNPAGPLDGDGEAVAVSSIWAEESQDYSMISGGFVYSTRIRVHTDYHFTARAGYQVTVKDIELFPALPMITTQHDFVGFVASHVVRNSLHLFDIMPKTARRLDDTGELELFCTVLQETFDRFTEDIDVFFNELCTIDYMREEWLDNLLYDLGDQFSEIFDLTANEKRRLAGSLVGMYREKGTCEGIVNAIDFFLGVTIIGCYGGWDDCWVLGGGSYPAPYDGHLLSKGAYPAATGGDLYLGPVGYEIFAFYLLHAAPGTLTADQLAKISAVVELIKPGYSTYLGVIAP